MNKKKEKGRAGSRRRPSFFDPRTASRVPSATYRLQFNKDFKFADALAILPYLQELGVTDCYASPILEARRGSTHGYDVTDHRVLNPEIGSPTEFDLFVGGLKERGMGLLMDVVPNHMAMSDQNPVFVDVLENGQRSKYSGYFDVDWGSQGGKLILPILGSDLETAISEKVVSLGTDGRRPVLRVYDSKLPLSTPSNGESDRRADLARTLSEQHYKLEYWKTGAKRINYRRFSTVPDLIAIRVEDPKVYRESHALILDLVGRGAATGLRIDHVDGLYEPSKYLARLQEDCAGSSPLGAKKDSGPPPPFFIVVEKILGSGERLPSGWRVHGTTGYEFLADLNAVYVERRNSSAFDRIYSDYTRDDSTFREIVGCCRRKVIDTSMESDLSRLAGLALEVLGRRDGRRRHRPEARYVKSAIREVAACFPVYRTYLDGEGPPRGTDRRYIETALREARRSMKGDKEILRGIDEVGRILLDIRPRRRTAPGDREKRAAFVKRFQQFTAPVSAKGVEDTAFYAYDRLVSLNEVGGDPETFGSTVEGFHGKNSERFRTHPLSLLTTSTHDTKRSGDARARINVLSEIPREWGAYLARWSELNGGRRTAVGGKRCPSANDEYMLYQTMLGVWPSRRSAAPAPEGEMVGRITSYMIKAIREEKRETSWHEPNEEYEEGVKNFVGGALSDPSFLSSFEELNEAVSYHGMLNSLSQLLLHLTCPGVPDVYQGSEVWDCSLVDPDNRRAVDYGRRIGMRSYLEAEEKKGSGTGELLRQLMAEMESGLVKMYVLSKVLNFRRLHRDLFQKGDYIPLRVAGARRRHVLAFARRYGADEAIVVAPRFFVSLLNGSRYEQAGDIWKDTRVQVEPRGTRRNHDGGSVPSYSDIFTRGTVTLRPSSPGGRATLFASEVLERLPVALLFSGVV